MIDYKAGSLVKSLAGHDKENLFIIIGESKEYVVLVDGIFRTMKKPKCKNKKHVQIIHETDETLNKKLMRSECVTDEEIKYAIRCYKRENQAGGKTDVESRCN